jgi:hypothetical protein
MTTEQIAERWSWPASRVRNWGNRGAFPKAMKFGSRWVIPGTDVAT